MHDSVKRTTPSFNEQIPFESLCAMNELAHILKNRQVREGSIDFELDEAKIYCDEFGRACDIKRVVREDGEKMIEQVTDIFSLVFCLFHTSKKIGRECLVFFFVSKLI